MLNNIKRFLFVPAIAVIILSACNKEVAQFPDPVMPQQSSAKASVDTIGTIANFSLYNAIIAKSGLAATLADKSKTYTLFVPGNAAVKQAIFALTGGQIPLTAPDATFVAFINSATFPSQTAQGIVGYNSVSQVINYTSLAANFPNLQYATLINPAPALSPLARLTIFPSKINGNYINNVPLVAAGVTTGNGMYYETGAVATPPTRMLWDTIQNDPNLTYLKAAILRADSGSVAGNPTSSLVAALQSIGANLTVFAPTDAVFKTTLYALVYPSVYNYIYAQAIAQGAPASVAAAAATAQAPAQTNTIIGTPNVFSNPLLFASLTAERVKGVVVYHMLGSRAFTNNMPTTATFYKTLLNNSEVAKEHPGVQLRAVFTGPMVSAATVKGVINATAANIAINPTPSRGTSDQHFVNGVIHKIDQVLLPMNF